MREVGRVQQGFYPTPDRVVEWLAKMLTPAAEGQIVMVDAGCGAGKALNDLRSEMLKQHPDMHCRLLGVESEKLRAEQADQTFKSGPGSGECLWAAIEDTKLDTQKFFVNPECSLLFFNPPFDRIRGQGRMEMDLFKYVNEWPLRGDGILVFILPDYVLDDEGTGVATSIERNYTILRRMKFPEPEYSVFKQCIVIAKRRARALDRTMVPHPSWADNSEKWPVMDDKGSLKPIIVPALKETISLRRVKLSVDVIQDFVLKSPVRGQLLMSAMADAPSIGRPPLGLSSGHLALALAGGLCDGVINNGPDDRFLVKGSLKSVVRKTGNKTKTNAEAEVVADIDIYKTRYQMVVRCLRSDGSIEEFSSNDGGEELDSVNKGDEEDAE